MGVTQKTSCTVERISDHGDHVYTVELRPERPVPRFRPGQFLHLALDPYEAGGFWPDSRVFSIASSPARRNHVSISYSVRGRFTAKMETDLVEGRTVWIKLPYGEFVIDAARDVVIFTGGTGITAFTAFLDALEPGTAQAVLLAYGARTRPLLIYRNLVEACVRRVPGLEVSYFIEELEGLGLVTGRPRVEEYGGRVSVDTVWPRIERPLEAAYYISGPPAMLQMVSQRLAAFGIARDAVHVDTWE